jgi:PLP dependent protein
MTLAERFAQAQQKIGAAARSAGRNPEDITMVVVTKNHPAALVDELIQLGHRDFGENRDQEAKPKAQAVSQEARWHFVGQLQTNKVKSVLSYATVLHSLDRESLLNELAKRVEVSLDCFIELNLTGDPQRGGVPPEQLLGFAEQVLANPKINLLGLMGVAGVAVDPRRDFETVLAAREQLMTLSTQSTKLSIGMSADFELAVEMGATHVRVGSAITGPRDYLT